MKVVNRRSRRSGKHDVYVGRPSALGNPYTIGEDGSREEVIQKYRHWLWCSITEGEERTLAALSRLSKDSVLVCCCAPLPCHAEVIARAWAWARKEGII